MSLRKMIYGLEYFFDGLICDHLIDYDFERTKDGGVKWKIRVRKWHPSYWLGYIRCVWLGDKCGSAYYKRSE